MFLAASDALGAMDVTRLLLSLAVLLAAARVGGEIARRLGQASVLGEILAGILLGPTLLGGDHLAQALEPVHHFLQWTFAKPGPSYIALEAFRTIAVTLLMLMAGLEVNLSSLTRQGKAAVSVSLTGIVFPLVLGFGVAWFFPDAMGMEPNAQPLTFALFVGIALSITALPVIAKTLMDLNLFRSELGMLVIASAMVDDLVGWIGFALVLAMMQSELNPATLPGGVGSTLVLTLLFILVMLTLVRWSVNRALPIVQAHLSWPGGVLGFILIIALLCAAFTERIGIHGIFGAFIAGVAIGDSPHMRERTRDLIHQFVTYIFAPVFFAGIGLRTDFVAHFDAGLVSLVLAVAIVSKVGGCYLGARLAKLPQRECLAIGFGMAGRGAMEIILGTLARQAGLITDELFVALVVMALVTSLMAGPAMQICLGRRPSALRLRDLITDKHFVPDLSAGSAREIIRELSQRAAAISGVDANVIDEAVWHREQIMSTGIGEGLAAPHARVQGITRAIVIIGRSRTGIDFNAPDDRPARLICFMLTPYDDQSTQIELLEMIAQTFSQPEVRHHALAATSYTEFRAALNAAAPPGMSSPIIPWRTISQAMNRRSSSNSDQSSDDSRPGPGQSGD